MPSLDLYRELVGSARIGQRHKLETDRIIEATWYNDLDARVAYFYDQFHDDEIDVPTDLHPEQSRSKVPVEIKFIQGTYNALDKDEQARRIMFKPSYKCTIDYYEQAFGKYFAHFPVGLYCDIPDDKGIYRRWLVVGGYTELSNQLPAYMVIPCDWKLQWVYEHQCYENWCCLRSQSSYNYALHRGNSMSKVF